MNSKEKLHQKINKTLAPEIHLSTGHRWWTNNRICQDQATLCFLDDVHNFVSRDMANKTSFVMYVGMVNSHALTGWLRSYV